MQPKHKIYSLIISTIFFVIVVMMISTWFTARAIKNEIMYDRQVLKRALGSIYKKKTVMARMSSGSMDVVCEREDFDSMKKFELIEEKTDQIFIVRNNAIKQMYQITCNEENIVVDVYPKKKG